MLLVLLKQLKSHFSALGSFSRCCARSLPSISAVESILGSLEQMETRFNRRYNYPYVFLNDEPFTESFKAIISVRAWHASPRVLSKDLTLRLWNNRQQSPRMYHSALCPEKSGMSQSGSTKSAQLLRGRP